ncbi:uncharacterized protein LOC120530873 isoform X2 [Polypterus senegalus]|uniref:uncharacterized protein LOC120530873 isoform X2 n=1 Tax=Polypterus senegalus TaxID=55291 RepID=UPI0019654941|nr:uncharacterized protein LOC120530873 isoform X2 [Polypterus senegalus]
MRMCLSVLSLLCWLLSGLNGSSTICRRGQKLQRGACVECDIGTYQDEEGRKLSCQKCLTCETKTGSEQVESCTKTSNTKCSCPEHFECSRNFCDECYCPVGRGLNKKECHPCPDGYFSSAVNSPCQKWTNCTEKGQKVLKGGSKTQDVVCSDLPVKTVPVGVTSSASHKTPSRGPSGGPRSQNSSAGVSHRTSQSPTRDDVNSQIRSTSPPVTQSSEMSWATVRNVTKGKPELQTPFPYGTEHSSSCVNGRRFAGSEMPFVSQSVFFHVSLTVNSVFHESFRLSLVKKEFLLAWW